MSTRSLIIRRKGDTIQYGQCKCDGHLVSNNLNVFIEKPENKKYFFDNFFEFEYAEVYNGKEYKRKGLGLVSVDKTGVEFYKDFSDDPNDWSYNNGEVSIDSPFFESENSFSEWIDGFDFPEFIHLWDDDSQEFKCFASRNKEEAYRTLIK